MFFTILRMPKKYLFYLLGLLLLAGLGFYGYTKWKEASEKVNLWTLVPEDAVFVIESGNHEEFITRLKHTQVWESLADVVFLRRLEENLALVDSIGGSRHELYKFLDTKRVLTSVHVLNKNDFELVHYVPVSTVKEHRFIRTLGENLNETSDFEQSSHTYEGILISDIVNKNSGSVFSYFTYRNNLIMSASSVLLEEIIRKIKYQRFESVAAGFENVDYLHQEKVYANVFINYHNLPPFLNIFFKDELRADIEYLCGMATSSMLEFKLENNKVFLNGFSIPETLSQSFYRHLSPQKPRALGVQELLPNRTAVLLFFGVNQPGQLKLYRNPAQKQQPAALEILTDSLSRTFTGEVALAYLQTNNPTVAPEKIVLVKTGNAPRTQTLLNRLHTPDLLVAKKSVPTEKFGRYQIGLVSVPEVPQLLFGNLFKGFPQTYYVKAGDYYLFGDDAATLKSVLTDVEAGNVWAKSVAQKSFLEETQHESNFSLFVNSVNAWDMLARHLVEDEKESLLRHEGMVKDFNQFSLQFSQTEKQLYTSIILRQQDAMAVEDQRVDVLEEELAVSFDNDLVAGPFPVKNPINQSLEMLVQDSAFVLHNVSAAGKVTWTDSIGEPIKGTVVQAPFGSDGKTKYLFTTANKIHCFDRNGKEVENFPYYLPDTLQAQRLTVLDWQKNGNYQLLVDDELGNLYLFDESGDIVPGWGPKPLESKLSAPPQLYRIGNKSVLLAVLENGYVYALNENGDPYPGFPFSVKATVRSAAFGTISTNFRNSVFNMVTLRGEVITFNLMGQITKRHQLARPDRNSSFELIPESNNKSYLIARQSQGRVTLLSPDFKLLLERKFVTSSRKIVQYFLFGGDKIVYAITETGPRKTYLFDGKAKPIGNTVISNKNAVKLFYNDVVNEYQLYRIFESDLKKSTLKH